MDILAQEPELLGPPLTINVKVKTGLNKVKLQFETVVVVSIGNRDTTGLFR